MKRTLSAATAFLVCACATTGGGTKDTTKTEQQKLTNAYVYFDVANCSPKAPTVPERITNEALLGVLVSARPLVTECLVDPKSRGKEKTTLVTVDSKLVDSNAEHKGGVEHKVTGTNLTEAGVACVQTKLQAYTDSIPNLDAQHSANAPPPPPPAPATPPAPPAKGKGKGAKAAPPPPPPAPAAPATPPAPITAQMQFQHDSSNDPAVTFGVNEGSDVLGAIRMAVPTWCDCFAQFKDGPPASFTGSVKVSKATAGKDKKDNAAASDEVNPSEVKIDPTNNAAADAVGACLQGKIAQMKFKSPSSDYIILPFHGLFVNSNVTEPLVNATPDLQFTQFDLLRGQRAATAAIAVGARSQAVNAYDAAVKHFKSVPNNKKTMDMIDELTNKCKALITADDAVVAALKAQQEVEEATHTFAAAQKAKDPAWSKAEEATGAQLAAAQKDVQSYQATRKSDEAACPKVKY